MARGIEGQNQVPGEPLSDPVPAPQSLAALGPERGEQDSSGSKPLPCRSTGPGFWVLPSGVSKAATLDDIFPCPSQDVSDSFWVLYLSRGWGGRIPSWIERGPW